MKKYLYLCLAIICVGLLASCKTQKAVVATISDLDGEWNIVELNGKALNPSDTHQFIVFDIPQMRISGNSGCNRMMGLIDYNEARKNIIKFSQIAGTRMACPDMSGEQELLQALNKVVRFEAQGTAKPATTVALYGTDNGKLMVIEKK